MKEFKRGERVCLKSDPDHYGTVKSVYDKGNCVRILFDGEKVQAGYYSDAVTKVPKTKLHKVLQ